MNRHVTGFSRVGCVRRIRIGDRLAIGFGLVVMLCFCGVARAQVTIAGKPYQERETRAATRDAVMRQITGVGADWGSWSLLAPLDHPPGSKNIDAKFPPEDELGRMKAEGPGPDLKANYADKSGKQTSWRTVDVKSEIGGTGGAGPIDLAAGLNKEESGNAMGYLYRAIAADRDVEVPVVMG